MTIWVLKGLIELGTCGLEDVWFPICPVPQLALAPFSVTSGWGISEVSCSYMETGLRWMSCVQDIIRTLTFLRLWCLETAAEHMYCIIRTLTF